MEMIRVRDVVTSFGSTVIHDGLNLTINRGEIYGILGESGSGKTLLLKEMIMLHKPTAGEITILGHDLSTIRYKDAQFLRKQWGILFQFGALFTSLTVAEVW